MIFSRTIGFPRPITREPCETAALYVTSVTALASKARGQGGRATSKLRLSARKGANKVLL
jgi:hypothetical protein